MFASIHCEVTERLIEKTLEISTGLFTDSPTGTLLALPCHCRSDSSYRNCRNKTVIINILVFLSICSCSHDKRLFIYLNVSCFFHLLATYIMRELKCLFFIWLSALVQNVQAPVYTIIWFIWLVLLGHVNAMKRKLELVKTIESWKIRSFDFPVCIIRPTSYTTTLLASQERPPSGFPVVMHAYAYSIWFVSGWEHKLFSRAIRPFLWLLLLVKYARPILSRLSILKITKISIASSGSVHGYFLLKNP